jgi:hypothetical protein
MRNLQPFAGTRFVLDQQWAKVIRELLDKITSQTGGGGGGGGNAPPVEPPGDDQHGQPAPDPPPMQLDADAFDSSLLSSALLAAKALDAVLQSVIDLGRNQYVTSTIVWFVPEGWDRRFHDVAAGWDAAGDVVGSGGRRAVNVVWDPPSAALWHWGDQYTWNYGQPHMKDDYTALFQALYPVHPHVSEGGAGNARWISALQQPFG